MEREHFTDAFEGLLGLALLSETDDGVDGDNAEDDGGVEPVPEHGGDEAGADQDVDQHVVEVLKEALEHAVARRGRETVGADGVEAFAGLGGAETVGGCFQVLKHGGGGLRVGSVDPPGGSGAVRLAHSETR